MTCTQERDQREELGMRRVLDRLLTRFHDQDPERVRLVMDRRYDTFDAAPIRAFVPILVEKAARAELTAT